MAFEHNPNRGSLWVNDSDNEKAPQHTGSLKVGEDVADFIASGGRDLNIAAWESETRGGKDYLSLVISVPQPSQG